MARFLFVYRGGNEAHAKMTPDEMQQNMQKWGNWIREALQRGWMVDTIADSSHLAGGRSDADAGKAAFRNSLRAAGTAASNEGAFDNGTYDGDDPANR